jgi:hypothetical protein
MSIPEAARRGKASEQSISNWKRLSLGSGKQGLVNGSDEMNGLRDTRNTLAHRAAPGRTYSESPTTSPGGDSASVGQTEWLGKELNQETTRRPRLWIADALTQMLDEAVEFPGAHL